MTTKKMCYLGILTALYVVLSAFLKFTLISNIQIDLGYIVYAVALCMFGPWGIIVGTLGCALESILFSAYGFSVSWFAANAVIGLIAVWALYKDKNVWLKVVMIILGCAVGMIGIKTAIECYLYAIPLAVKIPKNVVAFGADAITMLIGLVLYESKLKYMKLGK